MERCILCKYLELYDMGLSNLYCASAVPSKLELVNIAIESKKIWSVSSIRGIWMAKKHRRRLTFDHIVPVSNKGSFKADNIQIMLLRINQVKGTHDSTELTRFLSVFRKKKLIITFKKIKKITLIYYNLNFLYFFFRVSALRTTRHTGPYIILGDRSNGHTNNIYHFILYPFILFIRNI